MKIHINKNKRESKGCFGLGATKQWTAIDAYYELSSEERKLLNSNKNLLNMTLFELQFYGPDGNPGSGDANRTVKQMTNEKYVEKNEGYPLGCFLNNEEIQAVENKVNAGAKKLKAELFGDTGGSSITEI